VPDIDLQITERIWWLTTKPKRIKIAVGGRGSQKSVGVGDIMLMFADSGERICCAREFQKSIDESVHETLKDEIVRLGAGGYSVLRNEIRHASGGRIFYKGLALNVTSLKSLAGVRRLWIEEGEAVSEDSLKVLTPSIRSTAAANTGDGEPPEIWVTMNRGSRSDAIAKRYLARAERELTAKGFYEDDMCMIVDVNWRDNPWFPEELELERRDDFERLERSEYNHIWEGHYRDTVEGAIIKAEWVEACVDAHLKIPYVVEPIGAKIVSFDPSDAGDAKGFTLRQGPILLEAKESTIPDVNDGCDWATDLAIELGADWFVWDTDGIGAALRRQVREAFAGKRIDYEQFKGNDTVWRPGDIYQGELRELKRNSTNKDNFRNRRAQYYAYLRDRIYNTYRAVTKGDYTDPNLLYCISSECEALDQLMTELSRIPRKHNGSGLFQIMDKREMRDKYKIPSPNLADSAMMGIICPEPPNKAQSDDYEPIPEPVTAFS